MPLTMLVAQHYIPILKIKDPGDHGALILKLMFVGIFEQVVVLSELDNKFPFPSVSQFLSAFPGQPYQLHLRLQMIAGLSLFYNRRNCCR